MLNFIFMFSFAASLFSNSYSIVVDAGSTGSRASIFEIGDKIQWKTSCEDDEAGGIQALAKHSDVERHLGSTVQCIKRKFQGWGEPRGFEKSKFRLMATGGVRSISPRAQKQVLQKVTKYLKSQGFKDVKSEVLSGEKEGLYAWIAINYLSGTLGAPAEKTLGVLDMGGASTQIAFAPARRPLKHRFPLKIAGRTYQLYIHSYDGLGVNFFALNHAKHSCFQKNLENDRQLLEEVGFHRKLDSSNESEGNYQACKAEVLKYLKESCFDKSECGLRNVYQPPLRGDFVAIAGYAHFALKKAGQPTKLDFKELEQIGQSLCSRSWEEYRATGLDKPKYLFTSCVEAAFYSSLLFGHPEKMDHHNGFGFQAEINKIQPALKIDGVDLSWTLGAAVYMEQH